MAVPEEGDTDNHPEPPERVDAATLKLRLPAPPSRTASDCDAGAAPPAAVWKRNPVCVTSIRCFALLTLAVTATVEVWPEGASEIETVPVYVPAGKPFGLTVTTTELLVKGAADPPPDALSQPLTPEFVLALTVTVCACWPRLEISTDWDTGAVDPCAKGKLNAAGETESVGPLPPVTVIVRGNGYE